MNTTYSALTTPLLGLFQRELQLALRQKFDVVMPLLFFVIVVSLFPLAISPEPALLQKIAPGVIWVAALLASLLAMDRLFRSDYEDGTLEQLLLTPQPVTLLVTVKVLAHWILTGIPLIIMAPLLAKMLYLPFHSLMLLTLSLILGTPVLSFIGAIGSALTVNLRSSGVLLALLVLPLFIPVLIFGVSAATVINSAGHLAILAAFLALSLSLAPIAITAALRIGV
ncbi:heme exporter protein CcmB [soil metagenome]